MPRLSPDLRQAARLFARRPGVSALVVATLGIGIAATTIAFSLADAILWHPLPFHHADRLVRVRASVPAGTSSAPLDAWPSAKHVFDGLYPFGLDSGIVNVGGEPQAVTIGLLSPGLLGAIGVTPTWGRDFGIADTQPDSGAIIVSAALWRRIRTGSATEPVRDATVLVEGVRKTVVGVLPDGFEFPVSRVALWRPYIPATGAMRMTALGTLRPGVTLEDAQAVARSTSATSIPTSPIRTVQVSPFVLVNTTTTTALRVVLGAAAFLLLIAVANAANVLLADTVRRDAELAIRVSLGASWPRLMGQLLTETLLVTVVAVVLALLASAWAIAALVKAVPYLMSFQALRPIALDWRALSCAAAVAALAAIGASGLSILRARRVSGQTALRGQTSGLREQARARDVLTASQIAVTLALLAGAGLLANSVLRLSRIDPGFAPDHVVDVVVQMPSWRFPDDAQAEVALEGIRADAARLPDVVSATISHALPPSLGSSPLEDLAVPGGTPLGTGSVSAGLVDDTFFSTLRIPIISGRGFESGDHRGTLPVAIVSRSLAARMAPGGDVVGRQFRASKHDPWLTIVGVAGDIAGDDAEGEGSSQGLAFYTARAQSPTWWYEGLIVRTRPAPDVVVPELRALFQRALPDAPVTDVITADEALNNANARVRFAALLMASCAGVALALALIGIYGAFWCSVRQRTREIGVRLAVGATPAQVQRMVLRQGTRLAIIGIAAGLPLTIMTTRSLRVLLFGVSSTDPVTLAAVMVVLAIAAVAASYLPARRASQVDPLVVLRQQ